MKAIELHIAATIKRLKKINLAHKLVYGDSEIAYFKHYGLDFPTVDHYFGLLRYKTCNIASHIFVPNRYRATVVLVHGYLEHSGYFKHAVRRLLEERYAVVLFDLPGHGLSSGSPATIRDFSIYAKVLEHVVCFCAKKIKTPIHIIGHSMGCSAVIELLLTKGAKDVDKVILAAPLVHPSMWPITKLAYNVLVPIVKKVPRMFPVHSSDKKFMQFTLFNDPLLRKEIPLHWVHSMFRWNGHLERYRASPKDIKIIQGTKDAIVDWKYNVSYLKKKFPNACVYDIKDANHQLFNEAVKYRKKTLDAIIRYLKK